MKPALSGRDRTRRLQWQLLLGFLAIPLVAWTFMLARPDGLAQGRLDAQDDIAHGTLRLEVYGLRGTLAYDEALKRKYGIQTRDFSCTPTEDQVAHSRGYNEIMEREIAKRFGAKALQDTHRELEAALLEKRKLDAKR